MKIVIVIILVLALITGIVIFGGSSTNNDNQNSNLPELSYQTIQDDIATGAAFFDVRTPEEYAAGYAVGATNFSLQTMQAGTLPDIEKDTKVYVYCRSGNRSAQATQILENNGFTNVIDLGGTAEVQALGVPFTQ